jgi:hypothetical protein
MLMAAPTGSGDEVQMKMVFDLKLLKRRLGPPILLGDERMEDFDDYALAMAECLLPGDEIAAVLVYHYIYENWLLMRLRRLQGHVMRIKAGLAKSGKERIPRVSEDEERAVLAIKGGFDSFIKFDLLITQSAKRVSDILNQIGWYRADLAEALRKKQDLEEQAVETERKRQLNIKEEQLQSFVRDREMAKKGKHDNGARRAEEQA